MKYLANQSDELKRKVAAKWKELMMETRKTIDLSNMKNYERAKLKNMIKALKHYGLQG